MKRIAIIFLFLFTIVVYSQTGTNVAILGFINKGEKNNNYYNYMISESLSSFLSKFNGLKVLPYSEVRKVVSNELLLERSELDVDKALDIGIKLGANQILIGDYVVNRKEKKININIYIYDVGTGSLKLKRSYTGETDMDFFDTVDKIISIVGSFLLSRPVFLGKLIVETDALGEYLLYINDSFQKKITKKERFSDIVLAEENFVLSLKKSKTMEEVYRGEIFVKNGETFYFKYIPSGKLKISGKGFKGASIYTNEALYGNLSDSGEVIISNISVGMEYSVYLKKGNILSEKKKIKIEEGKLSELNFTMDSSREAKISLEKGASSITVWNITGYTMVGLGIVGMGFGYYFNLEAKRYYDLCLQRYDVYMNATSDFDSRWKDFEDALNGLETMVLARNISYISGGIMLGVGLILSFLPEWDKKDNLSFEVLPNYIGFSYRY
ncbi:MAG: hypothetical protein WHS77_07315 [Brevinematales bacterium]